MMKAKQGKVSMAYALAEQVLSKFRYPGKEGFQLFLFRREAQKIHQFQSEEGRKLIEKYQPEVLPDQRLKFKSPAECDEYCKERDELADMEVELTTCPFRLRMPADCELMVGDFEILDGLIEFYWPEEKPEEEPVVKLELVQGGEENGSEEA